MRNSLKLLSIRGVDIRLHFTFPLILIYAALQFGVLAGSLSGALFGVAAITILFVLVTLHELGHTFAAQHYGIEVKQIVLSPLGGVAQLREMPDRPMQELVIAAAGPAVNFAAAAVMIAAALVFGQNLTGLIGGLPGAGGFDLPALFRYIFTANLLLAAFNLLPAFPLDGGRILRALLALRLDYVRATTISATIGRLAAVGLGIYGLLTGGIFMILIAFFIFTAAGQEARYVRYRRLLRGYTVEHAYSATAYRLHPAMTLRQAADLMLLGKQKSFAVVEDEALDGFLPVGDLLRALQTQRPFALVGDLMRRDVMPVLPSEELFDVERRMIEEQLDALPVVAGGRYLGLITLDQIDTLRQLVNTVAEIAPSRKAPANLSAG